MTGNAPPPPIIVLVPAPVFKRLKNRRTRGSGECQPQAFAIKRVECANRQLLVAPPPHRPDRFWASTRPRKLAIAMQCMDHRACGPPHDGAYHNFLSHGDKPAFAHRQNPSSVGAKMRDGGKLDGQLSSASAVMSVRLPAFLASSLPPLGGRHKRLSELRRNSSHL